MEHAAQREGANSGTLAVRGSRFHEVMRQWEEIEFTFGLYMRTFFCDPTGLFFSMLEM